MGMSSGAVYLYMHVRISVLAVDAISSICGGDGLFPLSSESRALDRPSDLWWVPLFFKSRNTVFGNKTHRRSTLFRKIARCSVYSA